MASYGAFMSTGSMSRAASWLARRPYLLRPRPFYTISSRSLSQSKENSSNDDVAGRKTASQALQSLDASENNLRSPVHVPEDPNGVLNERHPAAALLSNSALVVERQLEMMSIMIGFEQANRYVILDPQGNHLGYMAEQDLGVGNSFARQMFRTHRRFSAHVFDRSMKEVLRVSIYQKERLGARANEYSSIDLSPGSPRESPYMTLSSRKNI